MRGGFPEFGRIRRIVSDVRKRFFQALESYNTRGQITTIGGSAQYPVEYSYDEYGRKIALYTLRGATNGWDITRWNYDEGTGLVTNKVYADSNGPSYTYTSYGKLETRSWARGVTTTYSYDPAGSLTNTTYSDDTPSVSIAYNRLGQKVRVIDAAGTNTFAYDLGTLALTNETQLADYELARVYDELGRASGYDLQSQASSLQSVAYGYDDLGRFSSVSSAVPGVASGDVVVNYSYLEDSDLLSGYTNNFGFAVEYGFEDHRNLKTEILNQFGTNMVSSFDYVYDEIGRRTRRIDSGAVTNDFGYNSRSELTSALMGTNGFDYAYDLIGNRTSATNNNQLTTYTANELNQYTSISTSMPPAQSALLYDLDGNLTNDSVNAYTWNGENRLIAVEPISPTNNSNRLEFSYDSHGRRIGKNVYDFQSSIWNLKSQTSFVYDGWNLIADICSPTSGTGATNMFVWGFDLSGSLQGAGGVGGLISQTTINSTITNCYFAAYDANGNIAEYVSTNGTIAAHFEYDPYGNIVTTEGTEAQSFAFRFSTKYHDPETDLYYYGYRYYSPERGRWPNRDPIEEGGGINLYSFATNNGITGIDILGLSGADCPDCSGLFSTMLTAVQQREAAEVELASLLAAANEASGRVGDAASELSSAKGEVFAAWAEMMACEQGDLACVLAANSSLQSAEAWVQVWDNAYNVAVSAYNTAVSAWDSQKSTVSSLASAADSAISDWADCRSKSLICCPPL